VQAGTSEKCGLFLQSVSYFVVAFAVGFALNAKLTAILFAGVIPSMTIVIVVGTSVLNKYSKEASECTTTASTVAEGALKAVQVVQAFGAAETLCADHMSHLVKAMHVGVRKAIAGAVLLGSVFFIA
jgi:ATP-binding cassette subfamily B (MDR/TAP) protein 1